VDIFLSPPAMECVEETFAAIERPRSKHHRRDGKKIGGPVPDLRFRWRTSGVARQPQGR
jgi:hypothetical protein